MTTMFFPRKDLKIPEEEVYERYVGKVFRDTIVPQREARRSGMTGHWEIKCKCSNCGKETWRDIYGIGKYGCRCHATLRTREVKPTVKRTANNNGLYELQELWPSIVNAGRKAVLRAKIGGDDGKK